MPSGGREHIFCSAEMLSYTLLKIMPFTKLNVMNHSLLFYYFNSITVSSVVFIVTNCTTI